MGTRPGRSPGALVRCRLLPLAFLFLLCACLWMPMVATDAASLGTSNADTSAADMTTTGSPAPRSGGSGRTAAGADAFRSGKRRIPKGPDPIHNRRAGKTTIAPRRRD